MVVMVGRGGDAKQTVSLSSNFGLGRLVSLTTSTLVFLIQDDRVGSFLRARRTATVDSAIHFFVTRKPSYLSSGKNSFYNHLRLAAEKELLAMLSEKERTVFCYCKAQRVAKKTE